MQRVMLIVAACAFAVTPAMGNITQYTSESSFVSQLQPGYYLEDFNYSPWTQLVDVSDPQTFSGGSGWAYSLSSASSYVLSGQPMPGGGGAAAPQLIADSLQIAFTGTLPKAVGGIFWVTDINGNFLSGRTVTIQLVSGGTYTYNDNTNWDAFTGYISDSPIASMRLTASGAWYAVEGWQALSEEGPLASEMRGLQVGGE